MGKNKVSIIILNYNEPQLTVRCIKSIKNLDYKNFEVILVDNGSKEDIEKFVKHSKQIKIIKNKLNLGYAEGNNVGIKHAKGNLILFLNNDAIVEKNSLKPLVTKLMSNSNIGAVQPKILQYPRKDYIDSVGSYLIQSGFLYHYGHNKKDQKKYNHESEIFSMKGACMLFKKKVLDKIGVFDPNYFAYFEETDLCHRVWLAGYKIIYTPESIIYHEGGMTSNKMKSSFVNFHSYKNRIYTYLKNFELKTIISIMPSQILLCEIASLIYLITFKFKLSYMIQKAIFWNISNFPKMLKEREKIYKIKKVNDSDYIKSIAKKVRLEYYYHLFVTSLAGYED